MVGGYDSGRGVDDDGGGSQRPSPFPPPLPSHSHPHSPESLAANPFFAVSRMWRISKTYPEAWAVPMDVDEVVVAKAKLVSQLNNKQFFSYSRYCRFK